MHLPNDFMAGYEIKFGTSGWRERMDSAFNEENVLRAAYGIGKYLKEGFPSGLVVVGYDARKDSDKFAAVVCAVLADFGYDVMITDAPTPTPAMSYSIVDKKAIAGVQVTASHNPPQYNGIKFMLSSGAAPLKDVTNRIESYVPKDAVKPRRPYAKKTFSAKAPYLSAMRMRFDLAKLEGMKVVIDTLYGAGGGYLADLLSSAGAEVQELHKEYDPNFGGMSPNPTEGNVAALRDAVLSSKASLGIANDGDADRFAILDNTGKYYGANESGLIIADYLFKYKGVRGRIAKSIQSTSAFDRLGAAYGSQVLEVPVGFKYIAKELLSGAVFGVEGAALGVAFGGWVPDKDGIAAGAAICEAMATQVVPLSQIWQRVSQEYGYGQFVTLEIPKMEKVENALYYLLNDSDRVMFGGRQIVGRSTLDGIKLTLDDGSWVLVRQSGTEQAVRAYIESRTKKGADELVDATKRFFGL